MPFLERRELSAVAPLAERTALNALHRLERAGLAFSVKHSLNEKARMRRWYLTTRGIVRLSEIEDIDTHYALRRFPLSAEWRRSLLRRMSTVATCYRVALDACLRRVKGCWRGAGRGSGPLDAVMTLPDRRTLGIARFGPVLSRRGMYSRLGSLAEMNRRNHLFAVAYSRSRPHRGAYSARMDARQGAQSVGVRGTPGAERSAGRCDLAKPCVQAGYRLSAEKPSSEAR